MRDAQPMYLRNVLTEPWPSHHCAGMNIATTGMAIEIAGIDQFAFRRAIDRHHFHSAPQTLAGGGKGTGYRTRCSSVTATTMEFVATDAVEV